MPKQQPLFRDGAQYTAGGLLGITTSPTAYGCASVSKHSPGSERGGHPPRAGASASVRMARRAELAEGTARADAHKDLLEL